ncbi:hypothetical protein MCETHM1_00258 [Flavobacteriaceae bacterium]|jgi:hypothetical protein
MNTNLKQFLVTVLFVAMIPVVSLAQKKVDVTLSPDSPNKVIKGTFKGDAYIDYAVYVEEGQMFKVTFKGSTNSSSFNLMAPDSDGAAMHIGDTAGNVFSGKIAKSGVYTIRVSQMRSAARKGTSVSFTLTLSNKSPK